MYRNKPFTFVFVFHLRFVFPYFTDPRYFSIIPFVDEQSSAITTALPALRQVQQ